MPEIPHLPPLELRGHLYGGTLVRTFHVCALPEVTIDPRTPISRPALWHCDCGLLWKLYEITGLGPGTRWKWRRSYEISDRLIWWRYRVRQWFADIWLSLRVWWYR